MSTTPLLSVSAISKNYGAVRAVREVSFEVAPLEVCGLIGPNDDELGELFMTGKLAGDAPMPEPSAMPIA